MDQVISGVVAMLRHIGFYIFDRGAEKAQMDGDNSWPNVGFNAN